MKKILFITNIPTPYRQKLYNKMNEIFPNYGIDFEVLYMAKIEPDRNWIINENSYKYKYKIFRGLHLVVRGIFAHFNLGLLLRLLKKDYDIAIIGGMASPTHWLAPFFISKPKRQIMWVESNLFSVNRKSGIAYKLKQILLDKADAYLITGSPQKEYIQFFSSNEKGKTYIKFPNLIDEDVFKYQIQSLRENQEILRDKFKVDGVTQMWVLPARLISIKGIIPFLNLIDGIRNIKLFLVGEGELYEEIVALIKERNLPVVLTGFIQQSQIIEYYAAADLFVLPSLKDPSPLSPIEASAAGLPLLVSSRIGNLEDVIDEDINGWSYDPIEEVELGKEIVAKISNLHREQLREMGAVSSKRYSNVFDTITNLNMLASELLKVVVK